MKHITVHSKEAAFQVANTIIPTDYEYDIERTSKAGYPIYWTTAAGRNCWISDLGDRLEVNLDNGSSVNIWIDDPVTIDLMGVEAEVIADKVYKVKTASGHEIMVWEDLQVNGQVYDWRIEDQYFTSFGYAKNYLYRRMQELETGVRFIPHKKCEVPEICGVDGAACRAPGACNRAICSHCPVAEGFWAEHDGIKRLIYLQ